MKEECVKLIDPNELTRIVNEYAANPKEKLGDFSEDREYISGVIYGMAIASMLTVKCKGVYVNLGNSDSELEDFEKSIRDKTIDEFAKRIFTTPAPIGENNIEHLQNIVKEIVKKMKAK